MTIGDKIQQALHGDKAATSSNTATGHNTTGTGYNNTTGTGYNNTTGTGYNNTTGTGYNTTTGRPTDANYSNTSNTTSSNTMGEKISNVLHGEKPNANTANTSNTSYGRTNEARQPAPSTSTHLNQGVSQQPYSGAAQQPHHEHYSSSQDKALPQSQSQSYGQSQSYSQTQGSQGLSQSYGQPQNISNTQTRTTSSTDNVFKELPEVLRGQRPAHETTTVVETDPVVRTTVRNIHEHDIQPVVRHVHDTESHEIQYLHGQESVIAHGKTTQEAPIIASNVEHHIHGQGDQGAIQSRVEEARRAAAAAAPDQTIEQERTTVHEPVHTHERGEERHVVEKIPVIDRDVNVEHKHLQKEVTSHQHRHVGLAEKAKNLVTGSSTHTTSSTNDTY